MIVEHAVGDFDRAIVADAGARQGNVAAGLDQRVRPDRHAATGDGRRVVECQRVAAVDVDDAVGRDGGERGTTTVSPSSVSACPLSIVTSP